MNCRDAKDFIGEIADGLRDRLLELEHLKASGKAPPDTQRKINAVRMLLEIDQFKNAPVMTKATAARLNLTLH